MNLLEGCIHKGSGLSRYYIFRKFLYCSEMSERHYLSRIPGGIDVSSGTWRIYKTLLLSLWCDILCDEFWVVSEFVVILDCLIIEWLERNHFVHLEVDIEISDFKHRYILRDFRDIQKHAVSWFRVYHGLISVINQRCISIVYSFFLNYHVPPAPAKIVKKNLQSNYLQNLRIRAGRMNRLSF